MPYGMITTKEVAQKAGVTVETISNYIKKGMLRPVKLGCCNYFKESEVMALFGIKENKDDPFIDWIDDLISNTRSEAIRCSKHERKIALDSKVYALFEAKHKYMEVTNGR